MSCDSSYEPLDRRMVDRARSKLHLMTRAKLQKVGERHGIELTAPNGRPLPKRRMVSELMLSTSVIEELGASADG